MSKVLLNQSTVEYGKTNLQFLTDLRKKISFTEARNSATPSLGVVGAKKRQPIFYLDSNIMIDVLMERNPKSTLLINMIEQKSWKCFTSAFAFMEMIDAKQDHEFAKTRFQAKDDYSKICRDRYCRDMPLPDLRSTEFDFQNFYRQYPFICPVSLDADGWDLALHIASSSNIFAPDVIHLAAAWMCGCDLLITHDQPFINASKKLLAHESISCFAVCSPEETKKMAHELDFEVTI